jgi:hypothetical protein
MLRDWTTVNYYYITKGPTGMVGYGDLERSSAVYVMCHFKVGHTLPIIPIMISKKVRRFDSFKGKNWAKAIAIMVAT